jgi:phosphonate transport system permease protein
LRSIPELIMGIVFVAAVGFGALPGVLALGLHSVGMVGKFFAEAIEHADRAVEAARAAGCSPLQVIFHGILPQVFCRWPIQRSTAGNTTSAPRRSWAWSA